MQHQDIILARLGEITLKGLNRSHFEARLMANLRRRLSSCGKVQITQRESRIWIEPLDPNPDIDMMLRRAADVFGIVSVSPVWRFSGDMSDLEAQAIHFVRTWLAQRAPDGRPVRFKVDTRRGNKRFPLNSMEISARLGEVLLNAFPEQLTVDVHQPDLILYAEVRQELYLYSDRIHGKRGLPVGTGGRGLLLLSGGIDSPVAGYLMAARGMELNAVYFHSFPFTSDEARKKVETLARLLTAYTGRISLHIVNFTDIQVTLRDHCPADMLTLVMRRVMLRIACRLAGREHIPALITGESLGQVASQTVEAIAATDAVADRPVLRPLIGLDKDETVRIAREIGTFDTSILPYEDCCTLFVAKHPKTHPKPGEADAAEAGLDMEALIAAGVAGIETVRIQETLRTEGEN